MLRSIGTFLFGITLLASVGLNAQTKHEWNQQEDPAWHQYLKEHHKKDHDWSKASKKEQKDYWKWRDAHPDTH